MYIYSTSGTCTRRSSSKAERQDLADKRFFVGAPVRAVGCLAMQGELQKNLFFADGDPSGPFVEGFLTHTVCGWFSRANRLVNWDSQLKSAVSDLEVDYITLEQPEKLSVPGWDKKIDFGWFWEWAYKVEDSDDELVIATTRPETMLGDTAVAVHPEDPRCLKSRVILD